MKLPENQKSKYHYDDEITIQLHKEELSIKKEWVNSVDVKVYKNTYTEVKEIHVPVTYEELVIEKRIIDPNGATNEGNELIRIPLSEEQIEVNLVPTLLEDVEIYKEKVEEIIQLHANVKEEKIKIETFGNAKVIDDNT